MYIYLYISESINIIQYCEHTLYDESKVTVGPPSWQMFRTDWSSATTVNWWKNMHWNGPWKAKQRCMIYTVYSNTKYMIISKFDTYHLMRFIYVVVWSEPMRELVQRLALRLPEPLLAYNLKSLKNYICRPRKNHNSIFEPRYVYNFVRCAIRLDTNLTIVSYWIKHTINFLNQHHWTDRSRSINGTIVW